MQHVKHTCFSQAINASILDWPANWDYGVRALHLCWHALCCSGLCPTGLSAGERKLEPVSLPGALRLRFATELIVVLAQHPNGTVYLMAHTSWRAFCGEAIIRADHWRGESAISVSCPLDSAQLLSLIHI